MPSILSYSNSLTYAPISAIFASVSHGIFDIAGFAYLFDLLDD